MKKLNPNEAPAGYVAVAARDVMGCNQCAFTGAAACKRAPCMEYQRADCLSVIFVKRETPPEPLDARLTIRLPASVKAKAQRIGAAAVIAAIVAAEDVT